METGTISASPDGGSGHAENPSRLAMAESRSAEAKLDQLVERIAKTRRLNVRHAAGVNLIMSLIADGSLEGVIKAIQQSETMFAEGWVGEEYFEECFSPDGRVCHMQPEYLDDIDGLEIDRMMYAITKIRQASVRLWVLQNLVACARSDEGVGFWQDEIEWFVRGAHGPIGGQPSPASTPQPVEDIADLILRAANAGAVQ